MRQEIFDKEFLLSILGILLSKFMQSLQVQNSTHLLNAINPANFVVICKFITP